MALYEAKDHSWNYGADFLYDDLVFYQKVQSEKGLGNLNCTGYFGGNLYKFPKSGIRLDDNFDDDSRLHTILDHHHYGYSKGSKRRMVLIG